MPPTALFEINEKEYEVEVATFQRPIAPKGWDPGAGGEVEPAPIVRVLGQPDDDFVTFDTFLIDYALAEGLTLVQADLKVTDALFEAAYEYDDGIHEPDYDDDLDERL